MFDSDLILAFLFMALLFVRQISILKQPNKINYAPLMIGIGAISSVVHFIIHPDVTDVILLLRESFFPLLVALLLYIVMNILHQTQQSEHSRTQDEFTKELVTQITHLKEFISELESRLNQNRVDDRESQEEVRLKFKQDIRALDAIKENQVKYLAKFDEMQEWYKGVSKSFEHFTDVQMPELDNVVHKHIDILRVAEQDHYNQLKKVLENAVDSRSDMAEDVEELKANIESMKHLSDTIAQSIIKHTLQQLSGVSKAFENQIVSLKSHSEGIKTSLTEGESTLGTIRQESEMIMKQMILSSNKMSEVEEQNRGLHNIYSTIKELMADMEVIKADYVKSQAQLSVISREFQSAENEQIEAMKVQIENLSESLAQKIDDSLEKLHEHYHIADGDISQSVQILAKKAQLQKGYGDFES
ncbi:MAG: hypothetical protein DRG78_23215 [Epsilonproteobacteria bacterium]|nr:MAG: hypothetical protein DRG78_23215 [Campylobacterota bacterium]